MIRPDWKRAGAFVVLLVCFFSATSTLPALAGTTGATYLYNMSFDNSGFTTIKIIYDSGSPGSGTSWLVVPKSFTETAVTALGGKITSTVRSPFLVNNGSSSHPFYDNMTFSYVSADKPFSMSIAFNMTNGAVIVEPNGFFFSPQISVPPSARVEAVLTLPEGVSTLEETVPDPVQLDGNGPRWKLTFDPDPTSRIAVTFTVAWPGQLSPIGNGKIDGMVPSRYVDLGENMTRLCSNALPLMDNLFGGTIDHVSLRFFTPLSLPDLNIGGYTPIDEANVQSGTIYLNLFYLRAMTGTLETILIHELTHRYLARVGISSTLLWVHEGLANYVAVQMGQKLGYDSASTDSDLETAAGQLGGYYGMVQTWQSGGTVSSLFDYYAASYHIFKTLGAEHGSLLFYSKFFLSVRALGNGLNSTDAAVYQLSLAANTNLISEFVGWGFELKDVAAIAAQIIKLRADADMYGPLLPFRDQALQHLDQAQKLMFSAPSDVVLAHVQIATFYIEIVPRIIGALLLLLLLFGVVVIVVVRRSRREREQDLMRFTLPLED